MRNNNNENAWLNHFYSCFRVTSKQIITKFSSAISANPFFFPRKLKALLAMPLGSNSIKWKDSSCLWQEEVQILGYFPTALYHHSELSSSETWLRAHQYLWCQDFWQTKDDRREQSATQLLL